MPTVLERLYDIAIERDGVFTAFEAKDAGVSPHALIQSERRGNVRRLSRGIYRLTRFPIDAERVQLWEAVLWPSLRRGGSPDKAVLSHLTALQLNYAALEYSPPKVNITIPPMLRIRRTPPSWLDVHVASVTEEDVTHEMGGLPVTTLKRTLFDCIAARVDHRLVESVIDAAEKGTIMDVLAPNTITELRAALG